MNKKIFLGDNARDIMKHIQNEMHEPGHPISKLFFTKVMILMIWGCVRLGVHPTILTTVKIILSILAAIFMWFHYCWWGIVISALLVYFAMCLDGVDGCVARLTNETSAFGAWLDNIAENAAFVFYFFGATIAWANVEASHLPWIILSIVVSLRYIQQLAMQSAVTHFSSSGGETQEKFFGDVGKVVGKFGFSLKLFAFGNCMQSLFVMFFIIINRFDLMLYFFLLLYGGVFSFVFLQSCIRGLRK